MIIFFVHEEIFTVKTTKDHKDEPLYIWCQLR